MRQIGSFMFIIGVLAIVLNFVGRVPTVLLWIYQWGDTTAWGIKTALMVSGAFLWLLSMRSAKAE
jgi:hypothetical protein